MSRLLCSSVLLLCLGLVSPTRAAEPTAPALTLRVMTYNVQVPGNNPPHRWELRRPLMRELLSRENPDIIGTQEGVYQQLKDIAADLPDHEWIGLGREGGSRGEFMAIFYRRDRFEPLAYDHFWLSDTPDLIGSATWGNRYRRMVTWVRFRDRPTGRVFEVWNTHFDHEIETARQKSAALIRQRLAATNPALPLLLLGDFNCAAGASAAYTELTEGVGLTDTWGTAKQRTNEGLNTFNAHQPPTREGERIDWILARQPAEVSETAILDFASPTLTPSDHFPVTATVRF